MKTLFTILLFALISNTGYSQANKKIDTTKSDTAHYKLLQKVHINKSGVNSMNKSNTDNSKTKVLYRPTRLGSSSPLYDTYEKNANGAGAITTNPHKSGGSFINTSPVYAPPAKNMESVKPTVKDSIPPTKD